MSTKEKKLVDKDSTFERASKYNLIYAIIRQAAANNTEANTGVFPDAPTNDDIYDFLDLPNALDLLESRLSILANPGEHRLISDMQHSLARIEEQMARPTTKLTPEQVERVMGIVAECTLGNGIGDIQYIRYHDLRTRLTNMP